MSSRVVVVMLTLVFVAAPAAAQSEPGDASAPPILGGARLSTMIRDQPDPAAPVSLAPQRSLPRPGTVRPAKPLPMATPVRPAPEYVLPRTIAAPPVMVTDATAVLAGDPCGGCESITCPQCAPGSPIVGGLFPSHTALDTLEAAFVIDGSKEPQDLGVSANVGGRFAVNYGMPLVERAGLGLQLGTSYTYTDNATQVLERAGIEKDRWQSYSTVGLFQRTDSGFTWALGYDWLYQDYYDTGLLGQWRYQVGYAPDACNEFGVWGTKNDNGHSGTFEGGPFSWDAIRMTALYWSHIYPTGARVKSWVGVADNHTEAVLILPGDRRTHETLLFGADVHMPLTDTLALVGAATFVTPTDAGVVDAYLGFAWYPGGTAPTYHRKRWRPGMPVAAAPFFPVDFRR